MKGSGWVQNLILNRYKPLGTAGSGGFGTVVAAWDTRIQRRVAIKCLRLDALGTASNPAVPRDIPGLEEARTAAMLSDAAIVGVYDFAVQGGIAYLIMEYMDGLTLTQLMRQEGALDLDVATCVFSAVARALEVAHENQVLHLDIKPDNVLINQQGQVKVTDFGLAQLSHEAGYGQAAGGTIGYMPLEQMRLEVPDERTDEWALASLTYEMFMAENPFRAADLDAAERAIEDAEVVIPSLAREDLDEEIDEAIFGALAIDREDRFENVALFADAMLPHMGDVRAGAKRLAALVSGSCEDGQDQDGLEDWEESGQAGGFVAAGAAGRGEREGRLGSGRVGKALRAAAPRVASAVVCCVAAAAAVLQMPFLFATTGQDVAVFWAVLAVAFGLMIAFPQLGASIAAAAWAFALLSSDLPVAGFACLISLMLWLAIGKGGGRLRAVLALMAGLAAVAFGVVAQAYLAGGAVFAMPSLVSWLPAAALSAALIAATAATWNKRA